MIQLCIRSCSIRRKAPHVQRAGNLSAPRCAGEVAAGIPQSPLGMHTRTLASNLESADIRRSRLPRLAFAPDSMSACSGGENGGGSSGHGGGGSV
jgi:hypothetical protein